MSALSYIESYGSDSDHSDSENYVVSNNKQYKLPPPNLSKICVVNQESHSDQPELHKGRIRIFPHVRGNWASFIYIEYPTNENLASYICKVQASLASVGAVEECEDLHISLSKTFVLKYHLINSFSSSLKSVFHDINSFDIRLDAIKIYCNEDESRTFVSLQVDNLSKQHCMNLTSKIDKILSEFSLPIFYEDPSFHMSILWINGNRKQEITKIISEHCDLKTDQTINVDKVLCKIGNKKFQYILN